MTGAMMHWALVVTVAVLLQVTLSAAAEIATYRLPEVRYADLLSLEPARMAEVVSYLTDTGALQITGIPRFGLARQRALEDLAECLETEEDAPAIVLADGARRLSCGASSTGVSASAASLAPMTSVCGEGASRLRSLVDAGLRQLFYALDAYVDSQNDHAEPVLDTQYPTFTSLLMNGAHLEHLHAYIAPTTATATATATGKASTTSPAATKDSRMLSSTTATPAATLAMHVDAGLFIGMTTGLYSQAPLPAAGLYLQLPQYDEQVKAEASDDALIVLVGQGATQWLQPVLGKALRAMPHALIAGFDTPATATTMATATATAEAPATRSWYGKMILPPSDALVGDERLPFHRYRDTQAAQSRPLSRPYGSNVHQSDEGDATTNAGGLWTTLPSACGGLHSGRISVVADACTSNQVWCWAQCMDASALSCSSSQYAACYNYQTHSVVSGDSMCMGGDDDAHHGLYCRPTCVNMTMPDTPTVVNTSTTTASTQPFCVGKGTTMFMQGFQAMPSAGPGDATTSLSSETVDCVNLLFDTWTLDTRVKFGFACVGVFLLAALTQAVPLARRWCLAWPKTSMLRAGGLTLLFGVDKTVGYFVMLVAMTYSSELFAMICLGLTAGYLVFQLAIDGGDEDAARGGASCCEDGVCHHHAKTAGSATGATAKSASASSGTMALETDLDVTGSGESAQRLLSEGHVNDHHRATNSASSSCERGACCAAPAENNL